MTPKVVQLVTLLRDKKLVLYSKIFFGVLLGETTEQHPNLSIFDR